MKGLTKRESVIFHALLRKRKKGLSTVDMMTALRDSNIKIPKTTHHSMTLALKYLAYKVSPHGYIIRRVSGGQGRGNVAIYAMQKEFEPRA